MAFKKGPAQAQKSGPKGAVEAKRKAPPTKKPLSANLDEDDDDLEEEDDDFSVDEDSDLSGADEELDDEELDDEELDDEELDEESDEEESEDEGVPAPKATKQEPAAKKAQGQQQKSPVKQPPQTPKVAVEAAVNGKRKAEFEAGSSPAKRIRLEDHIPPSFVIDYETRDLCDVKLTSFADGVTQDDVKKLCKDGTVVREVQQNNKLVCAYVRYSNKEKAVSAARSLQGASLKGVAIKASYCGDRWDNPATRPQFQTDLLDVRHVPKEYLNKEKLAALFPTGEVLKVHRDGYAQVKFPSNEALIKALKDPKCWTLNNQDLEFAVALARKQKRNKPEASKTGQNAVFSPKNKKAKKGSSLATEPGKSTTKGQTPSRQQPGGPSPKGSPQTPAQRKQKQKRSKTPGQQGGPKTPGQQGGSKTPGGPKTPGQQRGPRTPGQQGGRNTPGQQKGPKTPGQQGGPKTPGQQKGPKTPGQQKGPKTPGQQKGPKTPGQQKGPKTPGHAKGGAKTPKGTPRQKTPGMKETPTIA